MPNKKQKRPNPDLKTGGFSSKIYITLIALVAISWGVAVALGASP